MYSTHRSYRSLHRPESPPRHTPMRRFSLQLLAVRMRRRAELDDRLTPTEQGAALCSSRVSTVSHAIPHPHSAAADAEYEKVIAVKAREAEMVARRLKPPEGRRSTLCGAADRGACERGAQGRPHRHQVLDRILAASQPTELESHEGNVNDGGVPADAMSHRLNPVPGSLSSWWRQRSRWHSSPH